jgi:hypothetical protein
MVNSESKVKDELGPLDKGAAHSFYWHTKLYRHDSECFENGFDPAHKINGKAGPFISNAAAILRGLANHSRTSNQWRTESFCTRQMNKARQVGREWHRMREYWKE